MKRHSKLIPLSHDHHHALAQVRKLKAVASGTDDKRRSAAKRFLEFFHADTVRRFREEEEVSSRSSSRQPKSEEPSSG